MDYMRPIGRDLPSEMPNSKSVRQGRTTDDAKSGRASTETNLKLTQMQVMKAAVGMKWSSVRPRMMSRILHQRMRRARRHHPNYPNASDFTSRRHPGRRHD